MKQGEEKWASTPHAPRENSSGPHLPDSSSLYCHIMVCFCTVDSAFTPAFSLSTALWACAPSAHKLLSQRPPGVPGTGCNVTDHVPINGLINYLYFQSLPGTHCAKYAKKLVIYPANNTGKGGTVAMPFPGGDTGTEATPREAAPAWALSHTRLSVSCCCQYSVSALVSVPPST